MDKLRALRMLVDVVDAGSLTAAARRHAVSPATALRLVSGLEQEIGMPLVQRTTRRLRLVDEAAPYVEAVRRLLAELAAAEEEIKSRGAAPNGRLVVTAPVLFGQMHVAPCLTRFVQTHDGLDVKLLLNDDVLNLEAHGVDVAVRIGDLADSGLIAQSIGKMRTVLVASPAYLRMRGAPQHPRELGAHNCLTYCGASATPWVFNDRGRSVSVAVRGNFAANLAPPLLQACGDGLGIARVQWYQARPWIGDGRLKLVLADYQPGAVNVSLVYPKGRSRLLRVRMLLETFKKDLQAACK